MIKKRIKKIIKLTCLIAVRQIWKLLCNLYHIAEQPFLALKTLIIKDRDKSQMFLVTIAVLSPILAYSSARVVWDYYRFGMIVNEVGMLFLIASGIEFFLLTYFGYWIIKVMRSK